MDTEFRSLLAFVMDPSQAYAIHTLGQPYLQVDNANQAAILIVQMEQLHAALIMRLVELTGSAQFAKELLTRHQTEDDDDDVELPDVPDEPDPA